MPFDLPLNYLLGLLVWISGGGAGFVLLLKLRRRYLQRAPQRVKWANAGLSLWVFLAGLTLVELYFAIIYDQSDSFNMSLVSQHWFDRHVRRNNELFRDARPLLLRVPRGMQRVCFVGDSFTFGHGIKDVADRFSDRVGARLEAARPGKFLVANMGEAGINVMQVANLVNEYVRNGCQMDVLVYVICLNDIEGMSPGDSGRYQQLSVQSPRFFLFRNSYFLNLLYFRVQQAGLPQVRNYYSELPEAYHGAAWSGMRNKLDELCEVCRDYDIDLRIVIFPFVHNLGPEYPFDDAHRKIAEYCRQANVPCLDLKPILETHAGEGLTVNRFDAHPNARAHALAAEAIETKLLADLFAREG
ncbi:MAG: GDSL-type esterase/lipase family protein [Deltaproteobacteria bacterium]